MDRQTFLARSETFGFDKPGTPWGEPALRLLFATPRAYEPLVEAWEHRHPGTKQALARMERRGFAAHQPAVIVDTRTQEPATRGTRRVPRYRTTKKGTELFRAANEDLRVLETRFPRMHPHNAVGVLGLLGAFNIKDSHVKYGISTSAANAVTLADGTTGTKLPERTAKWWVAKLQREKLIRQLQQQHADVRPVIPSHWRPTRELGKQLADVFDAFSEYPAQEKAQYRLRRNRWLQDIDPARVGLSGATDYDHDVECQRILSCLFKSPHAVEHGTFKVEPKFVLTADTTTTPYTFAVGAEDVIYYQPDAEMLERSSGILRLSVIEYERFQSRRDGWGHIERFLAYVARDLVPSHPVALRFVVDSTTRETTYVELIQAFADYAIEHPERIPSNDIMLAVSSVPRLDAAVDPLHDDAWYRVAVPSSGRSDTNCEPVLHNRLDSPYNLYFGRVAEE